MRSDRRILLVSAFVLAAAAPAAAFAQNPGDERLLAELTALERASWEATVRDDKEFFRGYMAPEFKGFFADGTVAGREEFLRNLDDFHLAKYSMGDVTMMRINDHAAMVLYRASFEGVHKGKRLAQTNVESSSLYVRRDEKWLEIFYQETAIPGGGGGPASHVNEGAAMNHQESTVFAYDGQDFIRVHTTLLTEGGESADGTKLDRDNPGYAALIQKRSYAGEVTLFGHRCAANYAPLVDQEGRLTGALMVCIRK